MYSSSRPPCPHLKLLSAPSAASPEHTSVIPKIVPQIVPPNVPQSKAPNSSAVLKPCFFGVHGRLRPHCICNPTPFCGGGAAASLHTRIRNGKTASLISAACDTLLRFLRSSLSFIPASDLMSSHRRGASGCS